MKSYSRDIFYIALKSANLVSASIWSFTLVFALVRVLPVYDYADVILINALSAYVLVAELGLSNVVYNELRPRFLQGLIGNAAQIPFKALRFTFSVTLLTTIVFSVVMLFQKPGASDLRPALICLFLSGALGLPWSIVRSSLNAIDKNIEFECVELARRTISIALVFSLLVGVTLTQYAVLSCVVWLPAYIFAIFRLVSALRIAGGSKSTNSRGMRDDINSSFSKNFGPASLFATIEFLIYGHPYLVLRLIYPNPAAMIIFDLFFKITRFGAQSYAVANEGVLPRTSKAYFEGRKADLKNGLIVALVLACIPFLTGSLLITSTGSIIFDKLLNGIIVMPTWTRFCMILMLAAMMVQALAGTFLVNTGHQRRMLKVAACVAVGMASAALSVWLLKLPYELYMFIYVGVFSVGSAVYLFILLSILRKT